jgi:hypothetical protein
MRSAAADRVADAVFDGFVIISGGCSIVIEDGKSLNARPH